MMNPYNERALEGASGVELTIALYDGMIRFMRIAIDAAERGDTARRRAAVRRAMAIIIHLQMTLRLDIGGKPAQALGEFYAAMFALMLQGSQANSKKKFEEVIACVWNVREAWRHIAQNSVSQEVAQPLAPDSPSPLTITTPSQSTPTSRWTV